MSTESTLEVKQVINASPKRIFKALTDSEQLEQWFYAGEEGWSATVHQYEAKAGGRFHIDMINPEGSAYWHKGEFRELVPNQKIAFTWNSMVVENTLVTIILEEVAGGTEMTLTHEFLPNEEIKQKHEQGWEVIINHLDELVSESGS